MARAAAHGGIVLADSPAPRTFTPHHRDIHRRAHAREAYGWKNIEPYYKLRDFLEPDTGAGYWNVPSGDCYVGLMPRWYVTVWSYHYFENSLIHDRVRTRSSARRVSIIRRRSSR
jgi:hypothetical protein